MTQKQNGPRAIDAVTDTAGDTQKITQSHWYFGKKSLGLILI